MRNGLCSLPAPMPGASQGLPLSFGPPEYSNTGFEFEFHLNAVTLDSRRIWATEKGRRGVHSMSKNVRP